MEQRNNLIFDKYTNIDGTFIVRKNNKSDIYVVDELKDYRGKVILTPDDVWADLGANIGTFGVLIHDKVKKIYGFEPEPNNCLVIKEQIKYNKMLNYELIEKAVMNVNDGPMPLFLDELDMGHTLIKNKANKRKNTANIIEVPVISFKELMMQYPDINKIKMDIEGAEYDIVLNYDWSKIDQLIVEYHSIKEDEHFYKYNLFFDCLKSYFPVFSGAKQPFDGMSIMMFSRFNKDGSKNEKEIEKINIKQDKSISLF